MEIIDVLDLLTEKLNELNGIEFARDAWEDKAPDQYGVVEMTQSPLIIYADGKPLDAVYTARVTLYIIGDDDTWAAKVTEKVLSMENDHEWLDVSCRLTLHQFLFDIGKVQWEFTVQISAPLVREG